MTARDFAYWLQGRFELNDGAPVTFNAEQAECIRKHLALVFAHEIDPSAGGPAEQEKLNAIHNAVPAMPTSKTVNPNAWHEPPKMRC